MPKYKINLKPPQVNHPRLGEACSHIAAIISCLIKAAEYQEQSGTNSCTSQSLNTLTVF